MLDAAFHRLQGAQFGGGCLRLLGGATEDVGLGGGFLDAGTGGSDLIEVLELAGGDLADQAGVEAGRALAISEAIVAESWPARTKV